MADRFAGRVSDSPYFGNYERWAVPWRMAVGDVDGEQAIIVLHRGADAWMPKAVIHLDVTDDRVTHIADYVHCPWIVPAAASVVVVQPSST